MSIMTQADLAKIAGVSVKTVNRALAGHPDVNSATREKILRLASQNHYMPNIAAQSIKNGKTGYLTLLQGIDGRGAPIQKDLFMGMLNSLHEKDISMNVSRLKESEFLNGSALPDIFRKRMTDGVFVNYCSFLMEALLDILKKNQIPNVWLNSKNDVNCVYPNDFMAGYKAAEFLILAGRRNLAFLQNLSTGHYSARDRWEGFKKKVQEAGLQPKLIGRDNLRGNKDFINNFKALYEANSRFDGLVVSESVPAVTALFAALEHGISIPDDLEIVTFDAQYSNHTGIPMKYLAIPHQRIGQIAVEVLLSIIDSDSDSDSDSDRESIAVPYLDDYKVFDLMESDDGNKYINVEFI